MVRAVSRNNNKGEGAIRTHARIIIATLATTNDSAK